MTPEFNLLAVSLLVALFVFWKLDFIATLLTLKNLEPKLPEEFRGVWDDAKYAKAQDYERAQAKFGIISSISSLTLFLVFWFMGGFGWLDGLMRELGYGPIVTGLLFIGGMYLGSMLISLPFDIYSTFVLEEKFGFNKTTPATFVTDQIKGLVITALIGAPLMALILWIFLSVANAWIFAWLAVTVISLALTYLAPSLILPLFNKFTPLEDGELNEAIQAMAKKCDFPLTEISVMDGSKRSAKANAFFTGFGKRKKIALFDTLVEKQTTDELVAVLAHEIGHFKKKHIVQRLVLSVIQTAVIFFLLGLATNQDSVFGQQLYSAFGVEHSYAVGLVLFMIMFKPVSRIISIFMNMLSRKHEFEADTYASEAQGTPNNLVSALKKLSAENLSNLTPHPLEVFLDHSHPPVLTRIEALKGRSPQA
ncbi:M48 family metallopeptidase [bacterium]|nr:M48 family metallopeptidase [Akkermansiaceae bacterium]MDA7514531.1 M48 family metallopeptidase [bacterium]MDA7684482.1 M48 family metallopeptidase [Akkermansiaceae bacterium]MDA7863193.1 M48 family metallopeptidase [Akkermansiaceae bacterium]MDA7931368.1 M48 family metallopeptidase [Akkermansiaceae bacterium]